MMAIKAGRDFNEKNVANQINHDTKPLEYWLPIQRIQFRNKNGIMMWTTLYTNQLNVLCRRCINRKVSINNNQTDFLRPFIRTSKRKKKCKSLRWK